MKHIISKNSFKVILICLMAILCLASCGQSKKKKTNTANLNLDIGIGFSHFENDSDYPAPSAEAELDVLSSKIIIKNAYDKVIETPLIYNNSSTAYPRMKLVVSGNRLFVIYCPDISLPNLQIASTDDGGENWIQSTLNFKSEEISIIDQFTASFWSTRNGALIVYDATGGGTFIYFTDDSGKTWKRSEGAPPNTTDWHDSLYCGAFLSPTIGFTTYNFHSMPPNKPQVYMTLDGSLTWTKLDITVPASVMTAYAVAGTPFYDGAKINIPIELHDTNDVKTDEKYYVSYDFGESWEFYAEDDGELERIRNTESEKWFAANRPADLADREYFVSDFSLYSSFNIEENVRIDAYKYVTAYNIDDWSTLRLTGEMYFDKDANLYYKKFSGFPILLFVYEGDVFEHTYSLIGSSTENQYKTEGETHLAKRLYEEYLEHSRIKQLFAEATEAYSWFTGYGFNIDRSGDGSSMEHNGETYFKVSTSNIISTDIQTRAQLNDYLSTLFSEEIVQKLMDTYVVKKANPLFIDGEDGLYRFCGYTGMCGYDAIIPKLTVSNMSNTNATLTLNVKTDFYDTIIEFSHDLEVFVDTDGNWKMKSFILAVEKAFQILQGNEEDTPQVDQTEGVINDISDWNELEYSGIGGEQIKQFLSALLAGDTEKLTLYCPTTPSDVLDEYAKLDITDYKISKVYSSGQSKIRFDYTIGVAPSNATERVTAGEHSLYVTVSKNNVYLSEPEEAKTDVQKFLSDYFSSTLKTVIPKMEELRYDENTDITDFLIKRIGGGEVSENNISSLAYIIFEVYNFSPSEELKTESGSFAGLNRPNRGIDFDIISESIFDDEITVTIQFYADQSRLVSAGKMLYKLEKNGADYKFISVYSTEESSFDVYKITA